MNAGWKPGDVAASGDVRMLRVGSTWTTANGKYGLYHTDPPARPDDGHIPSRLDAARDRGYEPSADLFQPPRTNVDLGDWQEAFDASVAEAHRLKAECGVTDCGEVRCDTC